MSSSREVSTDFFGSRGKGDEFQDEFRIPEMSKSFFKKIEDGKCDSRNF